MAINRALMNRQMYNMGGSSLQTGAPDITLTGDMRPTYSAMRKQRMAYGGIAGLDGRRKYGIGSFVQDLKDKFVDDIIPNEIKENPVLTALGATALLNQFGLPDFITEGDNVIGDYFSDNAGQNIIGDVLGKVVPGDTQFDTVFGNKIPFSYTDITSNPLPGGFDQIAKDYITGGGGQATVDDMLGTSDYFPSLGTTGNTTQEIIGNEIRKQLGLPTADDQPDLQSPGAQDQMQIEQYKRRNLQADLAKALAAGTAAGAYVESQPKDTLPTDTTRVNFQTARQAMDDPNLRFKPPLEATQLAANGGRIGYDMGGGVMMASNIENDKILEALLEKYLDMGLSLPKAEEAAREEFDRMSMKRKPNRVMAQEGGLMDLGGMEKDYREEGGFVPIGGKEKADDVPARLSKNEFVFTADAVRNAGGGDIDEGAAVMERLMDNLEQGGKVSEESQGLEGAREMFETSQRLEKRII